MVQNKKSWYKRVWVWTGLIVLFGIVAGAAGGTNKQTTTESSKAANTTADAPKEAAKPAKWDMEAAYAKLTTGMTKTQVEAATGKASDNCTESDMGQYGKTESCSYGNPFTDKASIIVIYDNGELQTKSKTAY